MKLRFAPRAIRNISAIGDYLVERNPSAAARVRADIYEGLRTCCCSRTLAGRSVLQVFASW